MDRPTMHMLSVEEKGGKTQRTNQYIAAIAAAIGAVAAGTILAWTSPVLPQLEPWKDDDNQTLPNNTTPAPLDYRKNTTNSSQLINSLGEPADFLLDTSTKSLVSSIMAIGAAIAALPVGFSAQRFGRRVTILILVIPLMINWLLTIFANGAGMLIAARFFAGLATGGMCVAAPLYIGEIAETAIRGALGSFFQLFITVGILFTFVVGGWTHWKTLSIINAAVPLLLVAVFWWMPETPQYLLSCGRRREAEQSLRWLRGPHADLAAELDEMQKDVEASGRARGGVLALTRGGATRRAMLCGLGLMLFQQFSGVNAVIFYTVQIFRSAGSDIPSVIATIIVGVVQTISTVGSSLLIERAGRRILLLQSCIIMGLSLVVLGTYFKLQRDGVALAVVGWIPLLCLVLFIISFSMGFGPIPWTMMSELFPAEIRGTAAGITVVVNWVLVFIVTLCFPLMMDALGIYSCFWFFAAFMLVCVFFVSFLIPETKGKSLSQIQAILAGKRI